MEQAAVNRPGIFDLVTASWRSALSGTIVLLPVLAVAAAAYFGLGQAFPLLEQKLAVIRPANNSLLVLMVVPGAWLFLLEKLALGLVLAPAALVTMRRILADDGPHLAPGPLLRFWLWAAAALILGLGSLYLAGLAATPNLQLASIVLKFFAFMLPLLMLPVFPAIAAGEHSPGLAARMDKALERWDGNFWRLVLVGLFTIGPAYLLLRLPGAVVQRRPGAAPDADQAFRATLLGGAIDAALTVVAVVIVSAALAWWFTTARLPKPVRKPLGT